MQKLVSKLSPLLLFFLTLGILTGCSYKRKNVLFKTPKKIKTKETVYVYSTDSNTLKSYNNYRHRIKPGDRVTVRFLNNYDIGQAAIQGATSTANADVMAEKGYLVNYDSTIILPLIGRINIVGMTRLEAAKNLELAYGKYVINPIIEVNIVSLSATVLGEVYTPGKVLLDKENTTLVDILALSGGLKDPGKKNAIKIIRGKDVIVVNLKKIEALENKAIIIQDGDIVYVEPYAIKAKLESVSSLQSFTFLVITVSQLTLLTVQLLNYINN